MAAVNRSTQSRRREGSRHDQGHRKAKLLTLFLPSLISSGIAARWKNTSCQPSFSLESSAAFSRNSFPLMDIAPVPSVLLSVTFIVWTFLECLLRFYRFNPVKIQEANSEWGDEVTTLTGGYAEFRINIIKCNFLSLFGFPIKTNSSWLRGTTLAWTPHPGVRSDTQASAL